MNKLNLKLLKLLYGNKEEYISGEKISNKLGVSRTTIWKHINVLRKKGYIIDSSPNKGYYLQKTPVDIIAEEVYLGLKTDFIKDIKVYSQLNSTNEKAKELARAGSDTNTVIIAEEQLAGKGRLSRTWYSPKDTGLWFSLVLRPEILPEQAPFLTIIASLAVVTALKKLKFAPVIKWPNDILLEGKKVCGILSELSANLGGINFAVVGVGLNVNQKSFPAELTEASSLYLLGEKKLDRIKLLQSILNAMARYYQRLLAGDDSKLLKEWKGYLNILNKKVTIYSSKKVYQGIVIDISQKGELLLKDEQGKTHSFWAGDVSLRKQEGRKK